MPSPPLTCDLLVRNARVFTLDAVGRVFAPGAVAILGTRIAAVGPEPAVVGAYGAARVLDAAGGAVRPGFIDAHFHVTQHSSRGFGALLAANPGATVNFADWKAALGDEDEFASTQLAALDLLRNGYTAVADPGTAFTPDAVVAALDAVGVRGWVADPYLWDRREVMAQVPRLISPGLEARVPFDLDRALRTLGGQLRRNADPEARVRGHVVLYGLGTASDELQRAAKACADRHRVACIQHAGYVPAMTAAEDAQWGEPSVCHLAGLGVLDRTTTLVHLNVLRDAEVEPLVAAGPSVVWCPGNTLLHAAGEGARPRMVALARRGINVALGVDSTGHMAVGEAAAFAVHAAALAGETIDADRLLAMLTVNAARALGAAEDLGSLEPGKRADLVIRRADAPDALPALAPAFQLAVLARAPSVHTVIVDGRVVLRDGRATRVDERAVAADQATSTARMLRRLGLAGPGWP